jgi:hypothetical protein
MRRIIFTAPLTFDLLDYGQTTLIDELLKRTQLLIGSFDTNLSRYGIVDASNPETAVSGGTRPFSVSLNTTVTSTVDIRPGTAVFKSGEIIVIDSVISQVELVDYTPNARNVVYLYFSELEANPVTTRQLTLTNSIVSFLDNQSDYVKVLRKEDYDLLPDTVKDLTIPLAVVTNQIIVAPNGLTTVERLAVDMTRNTFASNRPWFSVVDAEHRSHLGTGAVTSTNVHGLSINDLSSAGNLTFMQVALDHGMVVAKDRALAGVPGYMCTEKILEASFLSDNANGDVTGIANAKYFKLSRVPRLVHRVEIPIKASGTIVNSGGGAHLDSHSFTLNDGVNPAVTFVFDSTNAVLETSTLRRIPNSGSNLASQVRNNITAAINAAPILNITAVADSLTPTTYLSNDTPGVTGNISITKSPNDMTNPLIISGMSGGIVRDLAPLWVPGSNIVTLLPGDTSVSGSGSDYVNVYYTVVDAAEPILDAVNPTFKIKTPNTSEVAISGGIFLESFSNTELTFENEGPIPSKYTIYIDETGSLQKFPQTVFCYQKLSDMGFTLQSFEAQPVGNCRLKLILAHAIPSGSLDIQILVTGVDSDGVNQTETVKFGSAWQETVAPSCSENPNQYVITKTVWSSLLNLIVSVRNDTSADTAILVQALVDPVSVPDLSDILPVAEVTWNGNQICKVKDIRPVNTHLNLPDYLNMAAAGPITAQYTASQITGTLYQYWAEDFDKPRYITTEVTDTTTVSGLAPTTTSISKLAKGLSANDTYVSRPIPVKPYTGTATKIKFLPVQSGAGFSLKFRYFDTTNWSSWQTNTDHTFTLSSNPVRKWQIVVTGPVQGLYAVLTTSTGMADSALYKSNMGAWIDGIFI